MRDTALVKALRDAGLDVIMMPMYLPLLVDAEGINKDNPVFFGGINVYLQQKFGFFRKTPRWLDKLFDTSWMLKFAAAREGSTEAAGLGPLTLSMLQGASGNQKKELDRLVDWLEEVEQPDCIHISNSLLLGLAGELKRRLRVPVVCSLQDEESWLDSIDAPYSDMCWEAMAECAREVDCFISVSDWYAGEMAERMRIPRDKIRVVPLGIALETQEAPPVSFDPPVIGYLSKMTHSLGLGRLVDAFIALKQTPGLSELRLRATGGLVGKDIGYVAELKKKLAAKGMEKDAEFLEEFDMEKRREFIHSLSVLSVPDIQGEAFGMYILEALAAGVPVVQPNVGAFPEVIETTGGGIIYDVADEDGLVMALESLLLHPDRAKALGQAGRGAVYEKFNVEHMAQHITEVYQTLVDS
jgi:glycosyltransferase involved in cell wall biosynthesis